ncbi:MAG: RadC family protein [Planctomycetota bacterium]
MINRPPYEHFRVRVYLERSTARPSEVVSITNSADAYRFFANLQYEDRETFHGLHLDARSRVLSCEEVSRGSLTGSLVHPREVFKGAVLANAASLLVAHNHPSGDPCASAEDRSITARLKSCGELLGIPLLDSLIIGASTYYSFADDNAL